MEPHARLSEAMRRRRLDLGMKTWRVLAERAGISYETLRAVRTGSNPADGTSDGLERALKWAPGSIAAVLAGRAPTPLGKTEPAADVIPDRTLAELRELVRLDPELGRVMAEIISTTLRRRREHTGDDSATPELRGEEGEDTA